jgi:hypothetical protein
MEGAMAPRKPPPTWSDPELLSAIQQAFDAAWPVLLAHQTVPDKARLAELSMELSHKLVELAANGLKDPRKLSDLALDSFPTATVSHL